MIGTFACPSWLRIGTIGQLLPGSDVLVPACWDDSARQHYVITEELVKAGSRIGEFNRLRFLSPGCYELGDEGECRCVLHLGLPEFPIFQNVQNVDSPAN